EERSEPMLEIVALTRVLGGVDLEAEVIGDVFPALADGEEPLDGRKRRREACVDLERLAMERDGGLDVAAPHLFHRRRTLENVDPELVRLGDVDALAVDLDELVPVLEVLQTALEELEDPGRRRIEPEGALEER